ncbi:hypothetical protein Belba_3190 [Belliella baltica DSM 15883]|uniref:Uncharacterized protein n=1 Tax=Belliella baltica (strain DSM 15883 / CIP 108006 / LMG 21964 / BA134) TaxID=866536 RepID=I3Z8Y4_BELBD|nr:hypothetical protein [Belliella baltica]AFL85702.1 hypothetical protein Belba_3190 [Belliella baltica DSM 15883]
MKFFYLSSVLNADGFYQVHERDCTNIPDPLERDYLGPFNNGEEALRKAKSMNPDAITCSECCTKKGIHSKTDKK